MYHISLASGPQATSARIFQLPCLVKKAALSRQTSGGSRGNEDSRRRRLTLPINSLAKNETTCGDLLEQIDCSTWFVQMHVRHDSLDFPGGAGFNPRLSTTDSASGRSSWKPTIGLRFSPEAWPGLLTSYVQTHMLVGYVMNELACSNVGRLSPGLGRPSYASTRPIADLLQCKTGRL